MNQNAAQRENWLIFLLHTHSPVSESVSDSNEGAGLGCGVTEKVDERLYGMSRGSGPVKKFLAYWFFFKGTYRISFF